MNDTTYEITAVGRTYTVEKVEPDPESTMEIAYKLRGKRGAEYNLVRRKFNPNRLIVFQARKNHVNSALDRCVFTDINGRLEVYSE